MENVTDHAELYDREVDETFTANKVLDKTYVPSGSDYEDSKETAISLSFRPVREKKKTENYKFLNMCVSEETVF